MSQENVAIVEAMWEAFLQGDAERALAAYDPEVEWDGTNLPDGRVGWGVAEVVDHFSRWAASWEGWRVDVERFIDAGDDTVVVIFRERGRSQSGLAMDERHAELYTVGGGKIVRRIGYSNPAEALEAAGLSE
jgi:ketosteroid isomerase-like protein